MKWKRSRKAQQESKNKGADNHSNNDDKRDRSNSSNQTSGLKNIGNLKIATNLGENNFHFPKNAEPNSHLPPHPVMSHQNHLANHPGPLKESPEENYANNLMNRQQSNFSETDDMIWRVV